MRLLSIFFIGLLLHIPSTAFSQINITGLVVDKSNNEPLPFATIKSTSSYALTSSIGEFSIQCDAYPITLTISYSGYQTRNFTIKSSDVTKIEVQLTPNKDNLGTININLSDNAAAKLIQKAIAKKKENNPDKVLRSYQYSSYNKFKITEDNTAKITQPDTTKVAMETIFNKAHSFLSEKISVIAYKNGLGDKETVLATRMTGFKKPVYDVLGIKVQSNSLYNKEYIIFNNAYAGPLSNTALSNYYYKVLDTTKTEKPAYAILFQPRRAKRVASLEGVLYLDTETLAIQKAIIEVRGELNIKSTHNFKYFASQKVWFPIHQEIAITPGIGKQKISLFGGKISVGRLGIDKKSYTGNNNFLISKTDIQNIRLNVPTDIKYRQAAIEIDPKASQQPNAFWEPYRTSNITEKDLISFPIIDSIVKAQNIERRIDIIQGFNIGYYPISVLDFDLTYPIKYNNFEGIRLGLGFVTNEKLSNRFRLEGYGVYGFKDRKFKYGLGGGVLLNQKKGTWLNINYANDLREVGSFFYLTDRRVYSLFEPRLVNIDFYYKHRGWSSSLQHQIFPKLLSETQISRKNIDQTGGYAFRNQGQSLSSYTTTESSIALRWSPFSEFLKTPKGFKEIVDGYPKISAQYTQGYKGFLGGDFSYTKIGVKANYTFKRLNQSSTSVLIEGDLGFGNIPLTHLFHAYPNAPTKETILQRFSVAGRRSFETMYFSEFFSDKLATLQIRHKLRPLKISSWLKPEVVLISRYALGDTSNVQNHENISFNSLRHGYQESGFEINKLIAGFGVSFAYRYGAYHLPNFEDNLAFKFTFYLKL